jgi:membrane associated rhomboid family serine protease
MLNPPSFQTRSEHPIANSSRKFKQQAAIMASIVVILWLIEIANLLFFHGHLDRFGIRPRTWSGLSHIFLAPWLHAGFAHLLANTIPLIILGWLVMLRSIREFVVVAIVSALVSGLGIWLFGGGNTIHLGASGVIFGFFGALLARAYFERSWVALGLAIFAGFFYGWMLWGLLPGVPGVSWLGHIFGFIGGILAAWLLADRDIPH